MSDPNHPARTETSPEGGDKDTNNLHDIKDVQEQGMLDKAKQVDQTPESVAGSDVGQTRLPQSR
ncbi:hypothetical protein [Deinococcus sp. Marseille-Q6407]|uniref:hypothetical protein n=1 Tax=Deinococcus sp. Marseille-Q6407 TaxID=2969223 RepID=UPI0021BF2221|nr:hypothetical protein [Deinococcus sp. Marseille-Q6407]